MHDRFHTLSTIIDVTSDDVILPPQSKKWNHKHGFVPRIFVVRWSFLFELLMMILKRENKTLNGETSTIY